MYSSGASLRFVGIECLNSTAFRGVEEFCGNTENGINRVEGIYECESGLTCEQCGPPRRGAAICTLATGQLECDFPEDYNDEGCFDGSANNTVISVGATTEPPYVSSCQSDTTFSGGMSICGSNWFMDYQRGFSLTCPPALPKCVADGGPNGVPACVADPASTSDSEANRETTEQPQSAPSAGYFLGSSSIYVVVLVGAAFAILQCFIVKLKMSMQMHNTAVVIKKV